MNRPRPRKRGTRLPDDWQPSPDRIAWCKSECPQVDGRTETEKFCNYWHAKAGQGATKLDWDLTWVNWILTARDRYGGKPTLTDRQGRADALDLAKIEATL